MPINASPALLLHFMSTGRLVNTVISNPDLEIRQGSDGRLFAIENYLDESFENGPDSIAHRALATVKKCSCGADAVALDCVSVGMRPIPANGLPVVGVSSQVDGLYVAVLHAGVTLAPAVGRFVTAEILDGMHVDVLEPCRLERFTAS